MSSVREFAARIAQLERNVTALSTSPQLGHSSLDNENVNVYDEDGNLKATVGYQHDGTYTSAELDGPVPPVPSGLTVEGGPGTLAVAWDGTYEGDARAPLDFRLVEIYVAAAPFGDRADAFLLGHFSNEAGGELTAARPVGVWHVGLVTKAESGRRSAVSWLVEGEVMSVVDQDILDDLDDRLEDLNDDLGELVTTIIPGLKDTINEITGVTLPALDDELDQAKQDIIGAFGAASDAQQVADAAAQSAAEAVGMVSGMGSVLFQDEQPGPEDENDSTLWIDTTDGLNISKRWNGSSWEIVRDPAIVDAVDKAIAAKQAADEAKQAADDALLLAGTAEDNAQLAIVAASQAQSSADGVAKNLFSTNPPSGTAPYGSIWFKVNSTGEVVGQWQQTATGIASTWTEREIRSEVIANLDVGKLTAGTAAIGTAVVQKITVAVATVIELHADQITAGTIDTERLNAEMIAAAVGTFLELRADQITASGAGFDTAVINQLWADLFVAHEITAEMINTQTFAADDGFIGVLNSATITGATIRTAMSGMRVELDSGNGIRIFNDTDDQVFGADTDGNLEITGSLNVFSNKFDMRHALPNPPDGVEATTLVPVATSWRRVEGEWVPYWSEDSVLAGPATVLLDEVQLSGTVGDGTALTIPFAQRGTFRKYRITVSAGSPGRTATPLVIQVNGRNVEEYRGVAMAREVTSSTSSGTVATWDGVSRVPRVGFVGEAGGLINVELTPRTLGSTDLVYWTTSGWLSSGSKSLLVDGGGRWFGSSQQINSFTVRTNSTLYDWFSGTAELWGER